MPNSLPKLTHIIYALADPDTHQVRYVGRTGQTAQQRLSHHLGAARRGHTAPVYDWIRGLAPRVPLLIILQELRNQKIALPDGVYESTVEAAETKWMKRFERSQLFNRIKRHSRVYRRLVN